MRFSLLLAVTLALVAGPSVGHARFHLLKRKQTPKQRKYKLRPVAGDPIRTGIRALPRKAVELSDKVRSKAATKLWQWSASLRYNRGRARPAVDRRLAREKAYVEGKGPKWKRRPVNVESELRDTSAVQRDLSGVSSYLFKRAKELKRPTAYLFNGVALVAKPGDKSVNQVLRRYTRRERGTWNKPAYSHGSRMLRKMAETLTPPF